MHWRLWLFVARKGGRPHSRRCDAEVLEVGFKQLDIAYARRSNTPLKAEHDRQITLDIKTASYTPYTPILQTNKQVLPTNFLPNSSLQHLPRSSLLPLLSLSVLLEKLRPTRLPCRLTTPMILHISHMLAAGQTAKRASLALDAPAAFIASDVAIREQVVFDILHVSSSFRLQQNISEQRHALLLRRESQIGHFVDSVEVRDDFEGVALVDEESLALGGVEHLVRVFGDERVEESIEAFVVTPLGSQDAA
jgi:hypothetical protein